MVTLGWGAVQGVPGEVLQVELVLKVNCNFSVWAGEKNKTQHTTGVCFSVCIAASSYRINTPRLFLPDSCCSFKICFAPSYFFLQTSRITFNFLKEETKSPWDLNLPPHLPIKPIKGEAFPSSALMTRRAALLLAKNSPFCSVGFHSVTSETKLIFLFCHRDSSVVVSTGFLVDKWDEHFFSSLPYLNL